mgnify:FL=1
MFIPSEKILSPEEKDTLKELMNIAFGSASADLAEVINIYLKLSIPEIDITGAENLADYIIKAVDLNSLSTLVEQKFWGPLKGQGVLIFPRAEKEDILSVLHPQEDSASSNEFPFHPGLEQGAFLEVGNILLGACVGKIAELMETYVTYSPPQVLYGCKNNLDFLSASLSKEIGRASCRERV